MSNHEIGVIESLLSVSLRTSNYFFPLAILMAQLVESKNKLMNQWLNERKDEWMGELHV